MTGKKGIFALVCTKMDECMKRILLPLVSILLLTACRSHRPVVETREVVKTVVVEKNKVSDRDRAMLTMLHQGCRNFSTSPSYSEKTWEGRLQTRLLELCNGPIFRSSQLGMVVYDITDGKYLFTVNGDHRMRPASCQKLVTAIAALDLLGGNYSYVPRINEAGEGWCWDDKITTQMPYSDRRKWTIDEILVPMMKDSDNRMAESLFWQLSAMYGGKFGDISNAKEQIASVMEKAGIPRNSGYRIADGSGLSLYNYVTPQMLNALLVYAWFQQDIRAHLMPSLPIAGMDGTLKNRMQGTMACNNIFAKTGSVTGVSTLSGYANGGNGHVLSFCIMNQGVERCSMGRDFQDQVCAALVEK